MGRKHKKSKSRKGHSRKNTPVSGACTTDAEAADIEATGQASEDWQDTQGHGRKNTPVSGACNTDAEAADIEAAGQASEDWQDTQGQDRKNTPVSGACNTDAEAADVEAAGQASEDWQDTQGHGRKNTPVSGACNTDAVAADIEAAAQASEDWQDTQDADYQKALELAWTDFKNDLIPDELLDRLTEKGFLSYTTIRDIKEMKTTTESIEKILKHVHQSGPKKYEVFKECLTLSNQEHLVTVLQEKEREVADDKLKVIPTGKGRKKMPMSGACKNDAEADEQVLEDVQDTQGICQEASDSSESAEDEEAMLNTTSVNLNLVGCKFIQLGKNSVMSVTMSKEEIIGEDTESKADEYATTSQTPPGATYAEMVKKNNPTQNITAKVVYNTINVNLPATTCNTESKQNKKKKLDSSMRSFLEAVNDFDDGHYILVAGKTNHVKHIEALSHVPWVAVFDFDPESRTTGLLSYVQEHLNKKQNVRNLSWNDKYPINEKSTLWIFAKGCVEQGDTLAEGDFKSWKMKTKAGIQQHIQQLKAFQQEYTCLTVVVVWPSTSELHQHINYLLNKMEDFSPNIVLTTRDEENLYVNKVYESLQLADFKVDKVIVSLEQISKALTCIFTESLHSTDGHFRIPTGDGTMNAGITQTDANFLNVDLEVLYIDDKTGIKYNLDTLKLEEDTFLKGGTLTWAYWYTSRGSGIDVIRDKLEDIKEYINKKHIRPVRSGIVTLYHSPGSGGTTLAQRILWDLHTKIPCAQVKHNTAANPQDVVDKIEFLSDKTRLPVLILIDGEDEVKVERIERQLRDTCVVILYVKRDTTGSESDPKTGKFTLSRYVSEKEALALGKNYLGQVKDDERKETKIRALVDDITSKSEKKMIFDFGLTVHSYKYKGIKSYVRGFLKLDKSSTNLCPWQVALGYLSLAHYYGHTGISCHFFSEMLSGDNKHILKINDFPAEMQEFIVKHEHEGKQNIARISHYFVAKEIIDQLLLFRKNVQRQTSPVISKEAKGCIANFAVEFIKYSGQRSEDENTYVSSIMTSIFISRDSRRVGENDPEIPSSKNTRKRQFSQILEDASSEAPYQQRFDIFNQLVKSFPNDPLLHSHLGRLYVYCRPELEAEAEECFVKALQLCDSREKGRQVDTIQHSTKQILSHVHHMFGNMYLKKAYRSDSLLETEDEVMFCSKANELLEKVTQACKHFQKCREMMTEGMEETYGFIGEIDARLFFCEAINSHCKYDVLAYAKKAFKSGDKKANKIAEFIEDTFVSLDCLFIDCFMVIDPSKLDSRIKHLQERYANLFNGKSPGYMVNQDSSKARRFKIAVTKGQYSKSGLPYVGLEVVKTTEDIISIVRNYEKNIKEAFDSGGELLSSSKRTIDIDHREWLFAIRTKQFPENYTIEQVLPYVQKWYDYLKTPFSRLYLFALKSILGFGTESAVNIELLRQAQSIKEEMLKYSKYTVKPKYPHEWLGKGNGIRRLLPGNRFLGRNAALLNHSSGNPTCKTRILKGTICYPNDKVAAGFINIDLGTSHPVALKAFFVPVRCDLKGKVYAGRRVEFVLAFSMSHGYDAFEVKLLKICTCPACDNPNVEVLSCDETVLCLRCDEMFTLNKRSPRNERLH